jgi:hypothetical protein
MQAYSESLLTYRKPIEWLPGQQFHTLAAQRLIHTAVHDLSQ